MENWQRNTISFTANNETKKSSKPDFSACNPRMQSLQADLKCVQTNWYIVFKIGQDIVVGTNLYLSCKDIWDIWADTNTGVVEVHRITVHRGRQQPGSSGLDRIEQHLLVLNRLEPILQTFCFPPSPQAVGFWLVHLCLSFALIAFFPAVLFQTPSTMIQFHSTLTRRQAFLGGKKRNCHEKDKLSDMWRKDGRGTNPFLIKDLLQPMVLDVRR